MFHDYKYAMQMEAERIAEDATGVEFDQLPAEEQEYFYLKGEESYRDRQMAAAEAALDRDWEDRHDQETGFQRCPPRE